MFRALPATAIFLLLTLGAQASDELTSWKVYGGDSASTQYSNLDQINASNVSQLKPAWNYESAHGEAIHPTSEIQINSIIVDGVLYGRNPAHNIFAVKADTGEPLWRHDPFEGREGLLGAYMRGVTYWSKGKDKRILVTVADELLALHALTGEPIKSFGNNGRVNLREGLGRDPDKISLSVPSPGIVYKNLIVLGSAVTEAEGAAPGHIRAYDVRSGKMKWIFHTIPHPGEHGYDTWPKDAWKTAGGANAWAGMSLDEKRGIVYVPTGSPANDFNGSNRHGKNLFGNSIIALNAKNGKRLWHYQTVHHDLWDRDLSSPPTLATITHEGKALDVLVQASKQGVLYVLDRETGEPVWPIEEVPVPASDVPGEQAWPTQPKVTMPEPIVRQSFSEEDLTDINPQAHAYVKKLFDTAQPFAYMRPPGLKPTLIFPGFYGGMNWGGGAIDPDSGIYYINATEAPHLVNMVAMEVPDGGDAIAFGQFIYQKSCAGCHGPNREGFYPFAPPLIGVADKISKNEAMATIVNGRGRMMAFGNLPDHERKAVVEYLFVADELAEQQAASGTTGKRTEYVFGGYNDFVDDRWYPAVKPPWGTLNAVDLNTGKRLWQVTLGEYEQLTKEGVPPTGTRNYGGPVVTKGGLVFIAASSDEKIRAFDKRTGKVLWEYKLPAGGYATPSTYMINGKQYLVIACGGGKLGTPAGDQYVAFALPD